MFIDTGVRLGERAGMKLGDVDFDLMVILVTGKGRRPRAVPFGARTAKAIDQYVRTRARHPQASSPALWIGPKGGMTDSGLAQMLERRCAEAGVGRLHSAPIEAHCRSPMDGRRRQRGGRRRLSDLRLALPADARPVRRLGRRRAGAATPTGG